jgi:hypothetical protein
MKHNSIARLRSIPPIRRTLSAAFIVLSIVTAFAAFGVPVNTSWTYQGQLQRSGAAYTGTCDFQFSLWDAASDGTQQGSTQSINSVSVVNGLFTVVLDFAEQFGDQFFGDARWLGTSVQCSGDGGFTPLDPRQPITAAPYALSLRPGAEIVNLSEGNTLRLARSGPGGGSALSAVNLGPGTGDGVTAYSENSNGVSGESGAGNGAGIYGQNNGGGYAGLFAGPVDVAGPLTVSNTQGVGLSGSGITGVSGSTVTATGVGVHGSATGADAVGVWGTNSTGVAIWGQSTGTGSAIYGVNTSTGYAGEFVGPVLVQGNLFVQGTLFKSSGSFRIDHPLDPANKFLSHSFVESPDMKNIYDGNVTTDATGSVIVTLPHYFEALNRDYRYQLTVLGQFAQAIVSRKIAGNSFEIRTDKPGIEVSWQVTGIRQDAYAQANPIVVEEFKPADEQGLYLFPVGFGAGEEKQIGASSRPARPQTEQKITK